MKKNTTRCLVLTMALCGSSVVVMAGDDNERNEDRDRGNGHRNKTFEFALIGDAPYAPTGGTPKVQIYPAPAYERMIADINTDKKLVFVVHAGDIKAGDTLCSNDVYTQNLSYFNSFRMPAIFVPGDNEWTDCH